MLVETHLFDNIEKLMCVVDLEEQARHLSGDTWMMETPDDYFPIVTIYFTCVGRQIVLRAAFAYEP